MSHNRELHLGFTIWPTGFHPAGWRLPEARTDGNSNPKLLIEMAQLAERGKMDFFFIGDQVVGLPEWQHERPNQVLRPEALSFAGFIAAATSKIGIVTTVNTTYAEPYSVARATATLDHLSGGRIGWNVVTGEAEAAAKNYNRKEHWQNERRYEWATEFADVVTQLWDSWEDGAKVVDKETGVFVDESKVHRISYRGEFFEIDGPLNVERPVQGQIPIVNAGKSDRSVEFGARFSDIKFTNSSTLGFEGAKEYYARLKGRLAAYGRNPDQQFIIPGLAVYTAETASEALGRYRHIQDLANVVTNLQKLSEAFGAVLSDLHDDTPLSEVEALASPSEKARVVIEAARHNFGVEDPTIRQIFLAFWRNLHFKEIVGDPKTVADLIELWFEERAVDGFMIFPPYLPGAPENFVNLVIPELQRRGIYRKEYSGSTLRDHFGLDRPENRFAASQNATLRAAANR
ncbi:NtaA/DmoA family FMN-dependent monooxygenase [Mesorhizobium sp. SB112]|uniref:NtaA/DmoA family FMN-dependent monooxygenase n=1 Tax=Mesorhizobium sp. SB112 TaxID=3151853 RepID=UPI0032670ADD